MDMEPQLSLSPWLIYCGVCMLLFSLATIIILIVRVNKLVHEKQTLKLNYQQIEEKYNQIELENLDSRLQPHLFKNILNSVQSHAYQTYFALDKL